jgi:hypothetical protein
MLMTGSGRFARPRFLLALLVGLPPLACGGKGQANAQGKEVGGRDAKAAAVASAEPAASAKTSTAEPDPPDPAGEVKDLGERFRDPPWFRKTMLEGAKAVNTARSEADEQGRFKSHILFEMPEGTTAESCADQVTQQVETTVANLERKTEADGRVNVQGSTDRYKVSAICGEAKGVMRAYVAYEWTR